MLFSAFEGILDRPDWVVLHSLVVRQHVDRLMGEADFVVAVPGRGVLVVEAKAPSAVDYSDGEWTLHHTPNPHKNPWEQINGAARSIRSFLLREGVIEGNEPFARLLWFTSIGRHHFSGRAPSDLTFFEWELAWADDLNSPTATVEKVLDEHLAWHRSSSKVNHDPAGVTADKVTQIAAALTRDFKITADERDARREIDRQEAAVLAEQRFALELMESNRAVYFDGPAGTGKSFLIVQAAIEAIKRGEKTLLTCWNVVMAERLRVEANVLNGPLWATDLGSVMLHLAGLSAHPEHADDDWYQRQLPQAALSALAGHPERGGYRNVVVDEFQDIAGNPQLVEVLLALSAQDARFMFAGDDRQQIMRPATEWVNPFAVAQEQIPDLVNVRIRRNCRQAPSLVAAIEGIVGRPFGASGYRLPRSTSGGADRMDVTPGREVAMLVGVLKLLVRQYGAEGVVVLSPWGSRSTAALSLKRASADDAGPADLRWLRANLGDGRGQVSFGSIAKMKGIETDAVVITDIGPEARAWVEGKGLDWDDLLYVALSRARYHAVVLEEAEGQPASAGLSSAASVAEAGV